MILATVCARGGSKGVPGKNALPFRGVPLVAHAVHTALAASVFDHVVASSDDDDLLAMADEAGADVLVSRPSGLAGDEASKVDVIRHAVVAAEEARGEDCAVVVDLDVTTPLRTPADIRDALDHLDDSSVGRVFTASPARRSPFFNQALVGEDGTPCLPCSVGELTRRQDSPQVYDLSGAVYVWRRAALFSDGPLLRDDARLHVIPASRAWDIDEQIDLLIIAALDEGGS